MTRFVRLALAAAALALGTVSGTQGLRLEGDAALAQDAGEDAGGGGDAAAGDAGSADSGGGDAGGDSGGGDSGGADAAGGDAGGAGGGDATGADAADGDAGGAGGGDASGADVADGDAAGADAADGDAGGADAADGDPTGADAAGGDAGGADAGAAAGGDAAAEGESGAGGGPSPEPTPTRVDTPTPAPSPAPADPSPDPSPVEAERPAPAQPAAPGPVATPGQGEPQPAPPAAAQPGAGAPQTPERVDAPGPVAQPGPGDAPGEAGAGAPDAAAPDPAAPTPGAIVQEPGGVVGAPGATAPDAAAGPRPSLPDLLKGLFGRRPAPAPVTPAATQPVIDPPPLVAPVVTQPVVEPAPAPARQAVPTATRPRIELSSGNGAASYRQYEISALGLTPRARQVVGALGFRVLSERRSPLLGDRVVARLRTPGYQTAEAALARVRSVLPEVTFDFSHLYRPSGQALPVRYGAEMIGATPVGACRVDARIGLVDSGVGQHSSLSAASITRRTFVERDAATNVTHGTAIASMLVGDLPGGGPLAPGAQVFAANVFIQEAGGLRADVHAIIAALDWMAEQRVPVINLSLMGASNALLEAAARAAAERGQVLVAAAGNDGPEAPPAYPAAYPTVIAVAAVDARGRPYGRNNRGAYVEVAAPGVDIWGADARGGEAFWTGTSFAAPFVTATLARDLAQGLARNINDARAGLAAGARDLGAPGRDPVYGHGLLQVRGCAGPGSVASARD